MKVDVWPTDGSMHHDISRKSIYLATNTARFLDGDQLTLLIATKGMGKTLLLRVKKKEIESQSTGLSIIPRDKEYDQPELHGILSPSGYEDIGIWVDIWTAAISFSALSHRWENAADAVPHRREIEALLSSLDISNGFIDDLRTDIMSQTRRFPSHYLNCILQHGVGTVMKFARSMNTSDTLLRKFITNGTYVFIDGFDQTLIRSFSGNMNVWRSAQLGLAKAVRHLRSSNHHVRVYASIRQEAWSGFEDEDREVIKGMSIIIEHSSDDLRQMFEHCIRTYSSRGTTIRDFLGVDSIANSYCRIDEDAFDYIHRHSASTARSVMNFGSKLHEIDPPKLVTDKREDSIRECINKEGGDNIVNDYLLGQKLHFLKSLNSIERVLALMSLIPANVLTASSLKCICSEFVHATGDANAHPFCELYNIGLLGMVRRSASANTNKQFFRKPYEYEWCQEHILSMDSVFLIHPSLIPKITEKRGLFRINSINIVGVGRPWIKKDGKDGIPQIFISHSSADKPVIDAILPQFQHHMDLRYPSRFWYDVWNIKAGDDIHQEVERGVAESDIVLVVVSKKSLESGWVDKEWRTKHFDEIATKKIRVVSIIIDATRPEELPHFLRPKKALSYSITADATSRTASLRRLADDVGAHLDRIYSP